MRLKTMFAFAMTIIASACQTVESPPIQTTPYQLNADEVKAVQQGVRNSLKDPTSAIFGENFSAAQKDPGIVYVCGTVNAKNSFGGYVGNQPFLGLLATTKDGKVATFNVVSMGGTDTDTEVTMDMCHRYGVI